MNTITIADIKRGGMAALDVALHRGAATIMKRNRPAAIVLTPDAYQLLVKKAAGLAIAGGALDWMLSTANASVLQTDERLQDQAMIDRLNGLKNDWLD